CRRRCRTRSGAAAAWCAAPARARRGLARPYGHAAFGQRQRDALALAIIALAGNARQVGAHLEPGDVEHAFIAVAEEEQRVDARLDAVAVGVGAAGLHAFGPDAEHDGIARLDARAVMQPAAQPAAALDLDLAALRPGLEQLARELQRYADEVAHEA